jgi:hypothetical protein
LLSTEPIESAGHFLRGMIPAEGGYTPGRAIGVPMSPTTRCDKEDESPWRGWCLKGHPDFVANLRRRLPR